MADGGRLYVCGTPIGNLGDVSDRLREVLKTADVVYAEDTRRTATLLRHVGANPSVKSLFVGNEKSRTADLLASLDQGLHGRDGHRCRNADCVRSGFRCDPTGKASGTSGDSGARALRRRCRGGLGGLWGRPFRVRGLSPTKGQGAVRASASDRWRGSARDPVSSALTDSVADLESIEAVDRARTRDRDHT